ncbi:DoxX family protein [Chitinophaga polysaccharea]|uniref:DoxX family protein n=1 Tax=Chitinophaga polysaccharea TaxID=1293035 RepID=UPI001455D3E3|nr:DoxX family protein [Chitinophaga polysaccharea]NLR60446.1 DoxX family protein [Chitinophaga polysaccharea]
MKLTYRISTVLFLLLMLVTAITDMMRIDPVLKTVLHLGYPAYLPLMIGSGKLAGILLLSLPRYTRWKEWAYAGFTVLFFSAAISHAVSGDDTGKVLFPLAMEVLLLVSYVSMWREINK